MTMKRAIVVLSIAVGAIVTAGWLPRSTPPCGCCSPTCRTSISVPAGSAKSDPSPPQRKTISTQSYSRFRSHNGEVEANIADRKDDEIDPE
jgi:hypothetical protein